MGSCTSAISNMTWHCTESQHRMTWRLFLFYDYFVLSVFKINQILCVTPIRPRTLMTRIILIKNFLSCSNHFTDRNLSKLLVVMFCQKYLLLSDPKLHKVVKRLDPSYSRVLWNDCHFCKQQDNKLLVPFNGHK